MDTSDDLTQLQADLEALRAENAELKECIAPLQDLGLPNSKVAELIKVVAAGVRAEIQKNAAAIPNSFHSSSSSDAAVLSDPGR